MFHECWKVLYHGIQSPCMISSWWDSAVNTSTLLHTIYLGPLPKTHNHTARWAPLEMWLSVNTQQSHYPADFCRHSCNRVNELSSGWRLFMMQEKMLWWIKEWLFTVKTFAIRLKNDSNKSFQNWDRIAQHRIRCVIFVVTRNVGMSESQNT